MYLYFIHFNGTGTSSKPRNKRLKNCFKDLNMSPDQLLLWAVVLLNSIFSVQILKSQMDPGTAPVPRLVFPRIIWLMKIQALDRLRAGMSYPRKPQTPGHNSSVIPTATTPPHILRPPRPHLNVWQRRFRSQIRTDGPTPPPLLLSAGCVWPRWHACDGKHTPPVRLNVRVRQRHGEEQRWRGCSELTVKPS